MTMHPGQKEIEQLVYRELANEPMTAEDMELKKHIMNCEKWPALLRCILRADRYYKRRYHERLDGRDGAGLPDHRSSACGKYQSFLPDRLRRGRQERHIKTKQDQ